jgi:hypothetical protein
VAPIEKLVVEVLPVGAPVTDKAAGGVVSKLAVPVAAVSLAGQTRPPKSIEPAFSETPTEPSALPVRLTVYGPAPVPVRLLTDQPDAPVGRKSSALRPVGASVNVTWN